jgi:hypothetical protein
LPEEAGRYILIDGSSVIVHTPAQHALIDEFDRPPEHVWKWQQLVSRGRSDQSGLATA